MTATIALIELLGYVILLLWGMRMVQSGWYVPSDRSCAA